MFTGCACLALTSSFLFFPRFGVRTKADICFLVGGKKASGSLLDWWFGQGWFPIYLQEGVQLAQVNHGSNEKRVY